MFPLSGPLPPALRAARALAAVAALALGGCREAPAPAGPPNVVLVSLDTFRADRVGMLGNPDGLTPNLDRFARESVVFANTYSQATITGPSHASVFTSRYPSEIAGTSRAPAIGTDMYTLPEVLGAYGYQSGAFVAGGDLNPLIGPTRGFDTYQASVDFGSLWHTVPMALEWLDAADATKPFFLFVHGYDTHPTYFKPTPFGLLYTGLSTLTVAQQATINASERVLDGRRHATFDMLDAVTRSELRPRSAEGKQRFKQLVDRADHELPVVPPADQELIRRVYDGAASYADAMFGVFLARLEARGHLDDTMIVVMGDHGEALGEEGLFHRCCSLSDELTHVPFLVRLPGGRDGGKVSKEMVELVDVMPTILELVGATPPAGIKGLSLAPLIRGEAFTGRKVAVAQGGLGMRMASVRSAEGRLTYTGVQAVATALPDIIAAARIDGPSFETTGALTAPQKEALRAELVSWVRGLAPSQLQEAVAIPAELKETLKAKGYWDAQ